MLDHIGVNVSAIGPARAFYDAALRVLGFGVAMSVSPEQTGGSTHLGYGSEGRPRFWIGDAGPVTGSLHVAFTAQDRPTVDAFYAAAMAAGGRDNGPPGIRAQYHPDYYGAFVLDPDGHNIEAVCHAPVQGAG